MIFLKMNLEMELMDKIKELNIGEWYRSYSSHIFMVLPEYFYTYSFKEKTKNEIK